MQPHQPPTFGLAVSDMSVRPIDVRNHSERGHCAVKSDWHVTTRQIRANDPLFCRRSAGCLVLLLATQGGYLIGTCACQRSSRAQSSTTAVFVCCFPGLVLLHQAISHPTSHRRILPQHSLLICMVSALFLCRDSSYCLPAAVPHVVPSTSPKHNTIPKPQPDQLAPCRLTIATSAWRRSEKVGRHP
jgi:hypothetical protein